MPTRLIIGFDVEKMAVADIELPKKMRGKVNEMLGKINAKKVADAKTEELCANLDKERERMEGFEENKLEKENQMKKDGERHRLMSTEIAKMTKTTASVKHKRPIHVEIPIQFHEALSNLLTTDTSFRTSMPICFTAIFNKLTTMSMTELDEILLHNGFSSTPYHRTDMLSPKF